MTAWGNAIGANIDVPVVFALHGDLGAGKSVFARAVARGAGIIGAIPSPTFNLMFRYHGARNVEVVHIDLYRLNVVEEIWELGWRELGADNQIVLIEWPERAGQFLPADRYDIHFDPGPDEMHRNVRVERIGNPPVLRRPGE